MCAINSGMNVMRAAVGSVLYRPQMVGDTGMPLDFDHHPCPNPCCTDVCHTSCAASPFCLQHL